MRYTLALMLLAPILLWQGRRVRRVTPRLPEPDGPRHGVLGCGPPLRLLVLGDSAAAGVGVAQQRDALTGRLLAELAPLHRVHWRLLAHTGDDLAQLLRRLPELAGQSYDVVVLSVGVNDVTGRTSPRAWMAGYGALLAGLRQQCGVRHFVLTPVPPMHRFPALPQPLRLILGLGAGRLNRALQRLVQAMPDGELLQTPFPLDPALMASDGFHPGAAAYVLWAQAVAQAIARYHQGPAATPSQATP